MRTASDRGCCCIPNAAFAGSLLGLVDPYRCHGSRSSVLVVAVVLVNELDLYYEVRGAGAPILGIHGTPSSSLMWQDAATRMARVGQCIVYDRRGFSRSRPPDPFDTLDLGQHVDDAVGLLDAVTASPAIVIGRSTGGLIALELARRAPTRVRALVLLEPAIFSVDPVSQAWAQTLREAVLTAADRDPGSASEVVIRTALGDATWESLPQEVSALLAGASDAVLAEIAGAGLDLSTHPLTLTAADLAGVGQPTLLVSAEDSPDGLARVNAVLATHLPNARSLLVPGGHLIDPADPGVLTFISTALTQDP